MSLFRLAVGYNVKTERVHFTKDGKATIIKVTEHVPAETKAAIAILQAYDKNQAISPRNNWRRSRSSRKTANTTKISPKPSNRRTRSSRARQTRGMKTPRGASPPWIARHVTR